MGTESPRSEPLEHNITSWCPFRIPRVPGICPSRPQSCLSRAHLYLPGCPWVVGLPEGLSSGCYLGPESPVAGPGARLSPQAVVGSPQPGAGPASGSRTGQQAACGLAGREPGSGGGAAGSSWACFPGHWGTAAAGPPGPPRRCWVVCPGDWGVLGPSSLHLQGKSRRVVASCPSIHEGPMRAPVSKTSSYDGIHPHLPSLNLLVCQMGLVFCLCPALAHYPSSRPSANREA